MSRLLIENKSNTFLFANVFNKKIDSMVGEGSSMLYIKMKKVLSFAVICFVLSLVLFATNSYAAEKPLFGDLMGTGSKIFVGMREIIYAVAGFGIVAVAVGGFFGNLNWKWLSAIIIGLMVIAMTAAIINYMTDTKGPTLSGITDTLKSARD